jgi:hypothetical protein
MAASVSVLANPKNGRFHIYSGSSASPCTSEGRTLIAAAQFKHGEKAI